ncbi:hypothetical protein MLD38_039065 [Melastoma candidum]|uniref:Uncharacterized protein n=1 Tax=Melastoma candidum TaxID=119954 RepID=A0ACB9L384_9MYRT|nr:hypothetical protein MLD38_039065 [Melastoma candidum]
MGGTSSWERKRARVGVRVDRAGGEEEPQGRERWGEGNGEDKGGDGSGYSGGGAGMVAARNLSRGIDERMLKLRSYGRIAGKVHLLKYLKRSLSSEMNCTLTLNLSTKNFQDLVCQ